MSKWNPFKRNRLGDSDVDPIELLRKPTGTSPMTDHAEQHSALTQIQRDNVPKFNANTEAIAENAKAIASNANQITGVYRNLESFAAAINENKSEIAADELDITSNTLAIAQLDNRVDDIEDFLGAVEFEIDLGGGSWTFDNQIPPSSAHFAASGYYFVSGFYEFWISQTDGQASNMPKWSTAKAGDEISIAGSGDNFGNYILESISSNPDDQTYDITAIFVSGKGAMAYGQKYEISIVRKSNTFEPSDSLGEDHNDQMDKRYLKNSGSNKVPAGDWSLNFEGSSKPPLIEIGSSGNLNIRDLVHPSSNTMPTTKYYVDQEIKDHKHDVLAQLSPYRSYKLDMTHNTGVMTMVRGEFCAIRHDNSTPEVSSAYTTVLQTYNSAIPLGAVEGGTIVIMDTQTEKVRLCAFLVVAVSQDGWFASWEVVPIGQYSATNEPYLWKWDKGNKVRFKFLHCFENVSTAREIVDEPETLESTRNWYGKRVVKE